MEDTVEDTEAALCKLTEMMPSVVKYPSDASLESALFHLACKSKPN